MPTTATATTTSADPSVRLGLARLLGWLTAHPSIRATSVDHMTGWDGEITLPTGRLDALLAAAEAAEQLVDPLISVTDDAVRAAEVHVSGMIPHPAHPDRRPLHLKATATVLGEARTTLLDALGDPPGSQIGPWSTTAAALREVAAAITPRGRR